ncbi:type I restriction enzyme, S subunit [Corynebacterium kutscheri]|uniref:Type I restriction enzyme, S subunit n=1 Tax=Corynebacterium kutscheri TaxID=35755 RepID=A0AB38VR14_9CORY|nr:restriction endonuclease subunit S [Corynebacterium kutscheri]VEH06384.1 type I restriction enzyme, S subunit [Corynebacterium kutscheri]VEH82297.1 type I restriction enzyme, S subunit [Corynebacterium kutscheri]
MSWNVVPLKRVASITLGKMLQSVPSTEDDVELPYARAASIGQDGRLHGDDDTKTMWFSPKDIKHLSLKRGDILVVEGGDVGRSIVLLSDYPGWGFQNSINRVRVFPGHDPRFIQYHLDYLKHCGYLRLICDAVSFPHLTAEKLAAVPIQLPCQDQQKRIAQYLDVETAKIDHLIAKQCELINLTNSRLQAWRELAFLGNGHGNPLECPPEGWEVLRNRHILEHVDGRSETGDEEMLSVSHLTGVTPRSMKNVTMFEAESTVGYRLVGQNELVINTMWAWMGALGVSRYEGIVSPAYDVYKFRDLDAVNPMYFDCMYRTAAYVQLMKANSRGIWESRLRLYPEIFLRLPSLVPPKETQDRLVKENRARTTEAERLTTQGNKAIELLQERRSALITAAVTGHIEV